MPSIATEFLRKRSIHDQTARQWTGLYAKPPPPPQPPSAVSLDPSSSSTNNANSSTNPNRPSAKGKGRANAQPVGADGTPEPQTVGIDLTNEGVEATSRSTRASKRRADAHSTDAIIDLSEEVEPSSTRGGKRRRVENLVGDVIVIED